MKQHIRVDRSAVLPRKCSHNFSLRTKANYSVSLHQDPNQTTTPIIAMLQEGVQEGGRKVKGGGDHRWRKVHRDLSSEVDTPADGVLAALICHTIIIIISMMMMIKIIIAFKGAIRDFFRTVSNTYSQVAQVQSCANHVLRTERLSCATCRVMWYKGTAHLLSLTEFKSHLFQDVDAVQSWLLILSLLLLLLLSLPL